MSATPSTAIAVFVKTPGLSPLKTRLAAVIGEDKAMEFYRLSLNAIKAVIDQSDAKGFWAVGEEEGLGDPLWANMGRIYTGEGGLGERQSHIYDELRKDFDYILLIGADAPQISPPFIFKAQDMLAAKDFVIGPAHDGGYYLFGGRTPVPKDIWTNIQYSKETTRVDLMKALPSAPAMLSMLSDVDTQNNLADIISQMPPRPNAAQNTLINWIETL